MTTASGSDARKALAARWISSPPIDAATAAREAIPVFDAFAARVRAAPDAPAILDGASVISSADALDRAAGLASAIAEACGEDGRVAILMPSGPDYVLALLGAFASGRMVATLDARFPAERNAAILSDFEPACVVHDGASELPPLPSGTRLVEVGARGDGILPAPLDADAPALVLYTSGSTGVPKGIVNAQRALTRRALQQIESVGLNGHDTVACLASPCTIAAIREIISALLGGAALRPVDPETAGLRGLRERLEDGATLVYAVPSLMRAVVEAKGTTGTFGALRVVRLGGEKVTWSDVDAISRGLSPSCRIQVGYSSTETTGSQGFVDLSGPRRGRGPNAGVIVGGMEYAVVDDDDKSVEEGEAGELVVKGLGVALGEWRGQAFRQGNDGLRTFRTGDIVRVEDGGISVLGRLDRQIKVNGRRVEPEEIEAVLTRCAGVREAVVLPSADRRIVAWVAMEGPLGGDVAGTLRDRLKAALPQAWCPRRIHVLERLPRLPGGKLDVQALRRMDVAETEEACDASAARTEIERHVAEAWAKTLGRGPIREGFEAAGGDSLAMLRMVFAIEEGIGRRVPLERLRMEMDVAAIAEAIDEDAHDANDGRPCVLLLPGATGDTPSLASLRADLSEHFRFVVARYPDWRAMAREGASIDKMADRVAEQALMKLGDEPLRIVAYSLGGAVGHETLRRLQRAGRAAEWLILLDCNVVGGNKRWVSALGRSLRALRKRGEGRRQAAKLAAVALSALAGDAALRRLADSAPLVTRLPASVRYDFEAGMDEALQMRALRRWVGDAAAAPTLPGRASLMRSREPRRHDVPDLGWSRYFEAVDVHDVDGDHLDMLRGTNRKALAARIVELFSKASGRETLKSGCA